MQSFAEPVSPLWDVSSSGDVRVLVVDDQEHFRGVLRAVIDCAPGFTFVGEACSGEEAAAAVAMLSPELVLMDVVMPGMGGLAAAQWILDRDAAPLVVLISVDDSALAAGTARFDGKVACIRKQELLPPRLAQVWNARGN